MTRHPILILACLVLASGAARAEDPRGCDKFKWNVAREQAALSAATLPAIASGAARPLAPEAYRLSLVAFKDAALPRPPERQPRDQASSAGFVTYPAPPAPGLYQVNLSEGAWLDLVQGGRYLKPKAFSGVLDCPGLRKIVRFELDGSPFTLQISATASNTIGILVEPVTAP